MFADERWIAVADRIGRGLCRSALWTDNGCFWLGSPQEAGGHRSLASLGGSLYSGAAGIGLFLAALARAGGDGTVLEHARAALIFAEAAAPSLNDFGLYSGRPGVAHALMIAGELLGDQHWIDRGLAILAALPARPSEAAVDVLDGLAGALMALERAARIHGADCDELMETYASDIVAQARRSEHGLSWPSSKPGMPDLLGYAHGVAGMAAALHLAGRRLGEPRFTGAAQDALFYENAAFDLHRRNWPDLRLARGADGVNFMHGWCHGAPGVLAGRLPLDVASWDLEAAVSSTRDSVLRPEDYLNWSLCHGAAGNADLLLSAYAAGAPGVALAEIEAVAEFGLTRFHETESDWPFGDGLEYSQLLTGVAGIGYFYLRLASRGHLPSVLTAA